MHILKIIKQNKFDLSFLFFLKLLSCIVIYFFLINFLNESPLKYPDLSLYALCDQSTTNALYTKLLCLLKLNHPLGMFNYNLIVLSILINFFISSGYYVLLKDYLSRKGQIFFIVSMGLHPYMAIYYPKFYTDIFGSLGIFLIFVYVYKAYNINKFLLISSALLINLRSALIPTYIIYAVINIFKNLFNDKKVSIYPLLLLIVIISSLIIYKDFSQSYISANNYYENKLLNLVFLLGFREAVANLGFGYLFGEIYWYGVIQLSSSIILFIFHMIGLVGFIIFSLKKNVNLLIPLTYVIVPLMAVSHLRYLLPIIPLIAFGFSWFFCKK